MIPSSLLHLMGGNTGASSMPGSIAGFGGQSIPSSPGMPSPPGASLAAPVPSGAIPGLPSPNPMAPPTPDQYEAVTQADGTVLLHLKNPDGSLGPAVKIISVGGTKKGNAPA